MLEGAKQEGTNDVVYSRHQTPVLEDDQERHGRLIPGPPAAGLKGCWVIDLLTGGEPLRVGQEEALDRPEPPPLILPPAEFAQLIRSDYEKYGKLIKDIGIKLD